LIEDHHPAGLNEIEAALEIIGATRFVGVDEGKVETSVRALLEQNGQRIGARNTIIVRGSDIGRAHHANFDWITTSILDLDGIGLNVLIRLMVYFSKSTNEIHRQ
jgi:hypothetical protein